MVQFKHLSIINILQCIRSAESVKLGTRAVFTGACPHYQWTRPDNGIAEFAGLEIAGLENDRRTSQGWKMTDWNLADCEIKDWKFSSFASVSHPLSTVAFYIEFECVYIVLLCVMSSSLVIVIPL